MADHPRRISEELAGLRASLDEQLRADVLEGVGLADRWARTDSPIGPVTVAFNQRGVSLLRPGTDPDAFCAFHASRFDRPLRAASRLPAEIEQAVHRVEGSVAVDLRGLTPFQASVLAVTSTIPPGQVRTYSWVAESIERPRAVRAVGSALGANPVPLLVPCHRVVRSDGSTGDYAFGREAKSSLLHLEGAIG